MARGQTDRIIVRQRRVFEYIEKEICVNTKQLMNGLGLTHSQAFYVLQALKDQGLIEKYDIGKTSIWCIAGHVLNDLSAGWMFISVSDLERAICRILENAKGHKTTIRPVRVADEIAEGVRTPLFLTYIADMLSVMLSNVEKSVFRDSRDVEFYVVDTCSICEQFSECPACETLRKKLNC
jgi:hypothetical protein